MLRGREFHNFLIYRIIHDNVYYMKCTTGETAGCDKALDKDPVLSVIVEPW